MKIQKNTILAILLILSSLFIQQVYAGPPTSADNALFNAIETRSLERVNQALDRGADPNFVGFQYPFITFAVDGGLVEVVKRLIQAGADVNATGKEDMTPLAHAQRFNQHEIVELIRAAGGKESVQKAARSIPGTHSDGNKSSQISHAENRNAYGNKTLERNDKRMKEIPTEPSVIEGVIKGALRSFF